jgi:hypothetical protein
MALVESSGVNIFLTNTKLGKGAQNKLGEGKT